MFLAGRVALIRPVGPADHSLLMKWGCALDANHSLARLLAGNLFRESVRSIEQILDDEMILIISDRSHRPLGYAMLMNTNPKDQNLSVDVFTVSDCPPAVKMESWILIIEHVFRWFPVNRIYRQLVDVDPAESSLTITMGFEEEGALKESVWWGEKFWTFRIFTLRRVQWERLGRQRLADSIAIQLRYEKEHLPTGPKQPETL